MARAAAPERVLGRAHRGRWLLLAHRRRQIALAAAAIAVLQLGGCAGIPIGGHVHLFVGIGLVRVDHAGKATGISSRSLGLAVGCGIATLGVQSSYCAHVPIEGDVAIIERGSGAGQHLAHTNLRQREKAP